MYISVRKKCCHKNVQKKSYSQTHLQQITSLRIIIDKFSALNFKHIAITIGKAQWSLNLCIFTLLVCHVALLLKKYVLMCSITAAVYWPI